MRPLPSRRPHRRAAAMRLLRFEPLEGRILLSALVSGNESSATALTARAWSGSLAAVALDAESAGPRHLQTAALSNIEKLIVAGHPSAAPPDTPADRVDPNTTTSPYAGVGSLAITWEPFLFICTGTAISPTHVLTAAHCLDLDDNGSIDVVPSGVEFNLNYGSSLSHTLTAADLFIHPDWTGFANPSINDDLAIVELGTPLPAGVPIYSLNTDPFVTAETATLVGHGQSGDGVTGYYVSPSFSVKRVGGNLTDFFDLDDEGSGAREVFQFDFDGNGFDFSFTPGLGNDVETTLGGGDSGGPAFIDDGTGVPEIFGVNTHGFGFFNPMPLFGSGGGGIVVAEYVDWINSIIGAAPAGIAVTPTDGLTTSEAGASDSFNVVLNAEPTDDVTISVSSADPSEGTVDKNTLTFTALNWDVPQSVTVTGADDAAVDGDVAYTIILDPASSADPEYDGLDPDDVSVTNLDDDEATALLLETGIVTNVGSAGWTSVSLQNSYGSMVVVASANYDNTGPPGVARIRNASGTGFEVRVDSAGGAAVSGLVVHYLVVEEGLYTAAAHGVTMEAVKFTSTVTDGKNNWTGQSRSYGNTYSDPVVVGQVMSYNDPDYSVFWSGGSDRTEPPSSSFLRVGKHVGEDPDTTRADEMLGYVVIEAGSATLSDGRDVFAARGADVVRGMDNAPPYVYSPGVAFDPSSAIVDLAGMDGGDGGWAVLYGADPAAADALKLAVDEDQNDAERAHTTEQVAYLLFGAPPGPEPGITVTPTSGLVTTEAGATATFDVVLNSQPSANVTIGISSSDATEGAVSSATLVFTAADWNVPQTVTVSGLDDDVDDGDVPYQVITAAASSADADYDGLDADDVAVTNVDDDTAGITVTPTSGLETSEAGGSDTFEVVLDSEPTADVTVPVSSSDLTEGTVPVATLTFTPANWFVPQTVTVAGVDDPDPDGPVAYSIVTGASTSADPQYNGLDPADVAVTNLDDESPPGAALTLEHGFAVGVTNTAWLTVPLNNSYTSMVVVATVNYKQPRPPLVARIRNAVGSSFEIRVDRADGLMTPEPAINVAYVVVEEGVYTAAEHGVTLEAVKFTSTVTDSNGSWNGQLRPYANSYTNPVVVGQVMSDNDEDFSVFWAAGAARQDPPSSATLRVGKHVGEDPDTTRSNETIGYVVIETGTGPIGSLHYEAGVGADIVTGFDDPAPTTYSVGLLPSGAAVSQAGMDGGNGGWAILYGNNPLTPGVIKLAIDEDQLSDAERNHTTEQVAYLIFGTPVSTAASLAEAMSEQPTSFTVPVGNAALLLRRQPAVDHAGPRDLDIVQDGPGRALAAETSAVAHRPAREPAPQLERHMADAALERLTSDGFHDDLIELLALEGERGRL